MPTINFGELGLGKNAPYGFVAGETPQLIPISDFADGIVVTLNG
jgi:hypothetical protein